MAADIIDGRAIAAQVRAEVAERVERLSAGGIVPGLATVLVGDDPASKVYIASKHKACADVGIRSWDHHLAAGTTQDDLLGLLERFNRDDEVHGILVQVPLPAHIDEQAVLDALSPSKDADGFQPANLGRTLMGVPRVAPATPAGIQQLLLRSGVETAGAEVVIIGRSNIVGKPLAALMMQKGSAANATVTICHTSTRDLAGHTARADILVAAVGHPRVVTAPMVKPGAIVVDVGMNRTEDGLSGDVDFEGVREVAGAITPVPGGVGPMTIAMLLSNVATLAEAAAGLG